MDNERKIENPNDAQDETETNMDISNETESEAGTPPSGNNSSAKEGENSEPKKRQSLASHHRKHHHHHHYHSHHHSEGHGQSGDNSNAGEYDTELNRHHSSHRYRLLRHRTRSSRKYIGNSENGSQLETIEIDREEFERLQTEHMENYPADKETELVGAKVFAEADQIVEGSIVSEGPRLAGMISKAREMKTSSVRKASSIKSIGSRQRQKKATLVSIILRVLIGITAVLLGGICILLYMRNRGQSSMTPKADDVEIVMPEDDVPDGVDKIENDGKTITYKGHKYRWNDKITTILILGTDRTLEQQEHGETMAGANGQADTILLGVVDNKNKKISFINVNRDTFVPVAKYTPDGGFIGEEKMQICLSYAYGKDDVTSCRYTTEAVSKYLYGMPVNYYTSLSYDAIPTLNDSVGGVTVTVLEDLTKADGAMTVGSTITLVGSQALTYVRWRDRSIVKTNENRISRQRQYLTEFMKRTLTATREDLTLPLRLYSTAKPYMTSNVSISQITYLTSKVLEYGISGNAIQTIPGKSVPGAGNHIEYYPDETALYEMMLGIFYNRMD